MRGIRGRVQRWQAGRRPRSRERASEAPYVVPTKLRPPHVQDGLLQRPDLVERLRSGRERTLTLVCAPAGYGKTTLLAQWAAADADRTAFAWVSLDAMDSDPARLWGHVIAALQEVHGRAGERSLVAFAAGPRAIAETGLPLLVDELSDCPPVVLVLEDWHVVASRACDETVGVFVDRAPERRPGRHLEPPRPPPADCPAPRPRRPDGAQSARSQRLVHRGRRALSRGRRSAHDP